MKEQNTKRKKLAGRFKYTAWLVTSDVPYLK